ncbi:CRT (chloroquine-resistance transporter)-like transporter 2 [Striga hermonthica]|uniref:CRT (Chloroquine-resistance transporter)-like transporter 2 n=1 Tax=Striga hermonthica TaxID=68872 RepID=A0A9N7MNY6_STRHE|nr:CRT (chloroquine-resistance transporter)-like transporter 2 [Striga hermonthica]
MPPFPSLRSSIAMNNLRSPHYSSSSAPPIKPLSGLPFNHHFNLNPDKIPPVKFSIYYHNTSCKLRLRSLPPLSAAKKDITSPPPHAPDRKLYAAVCCAVTVALAIANRVFYKLALVPMKEFPFFLAQLTTFGYVAVYFSALNMRYRAGIATDEMLAIPKWPFVFIGLLEALGVVSGMYSGAMLPGPAIPILSQTFLVWQLAFSVLLLRRSYSLNRLAGCFLVAAGVVLAVTSGSEHNQILSGVGVIWPAMMIVSTAFQAVASVLKESVFLDAATRLKGKLLDIFVVNSFGSGFQALFVLLFLPFLSNLKGIPLSELPSYLRSGAACFLHVGNKTTGCDGAPLLPILYIITNIAFNISVLNLLKLSSAVVSSLAVMSSVPISIYILSLPLPYLPEGVNLSPYFVLGSLVLMMGLIVYNASWPLKQNSDIS